MENKNIITEALRKIYQTQTHLDALEGLADEAFKVFHLRCSLNEMENILKNSWKKLSYWNVKNPDAPQFHMQNWPTIENAFFNVTTARINRKEFSEILAESRNSVNECIEEMKTTLSEEKKKISDLYDEFVNNADSLKFIFQEEQVKQLIMDKLLKL